MNLVVFPSCSTYSYLKNQICKFQIKNPIYVYYNFTQADFCDLDFVENEDAESRLKIALEFIKKICEENKDVKINVYLFTPNISYFYDDIDINDYILDNVIKFNYIFKECQRLWKKDFNENWLLNKKITKIKIEN